MPPNKSNLRSTAACDEKKYYTTHAIYLYDKVDKEYLKIYTHTQTHNI
jgi:uncharacterized protein YhbP (UPF0306 family)